MAKKKTSVEQKRQCCGRACTVSVWFAPILNWASDCFDILISEKHIVKCSSVKKKNYCLVFRRSKEMHIWNSYNWWFCGSNYPLSTHVVRGGEKIYCDEICSCLTNEWKCKKICRCRMKALHFTSVFKTNGLNCSGALRRKNNVNFLIIKCGVIWINGFGFNSYRTNSMYVFFLYIFIENVNVHRTGMTRQGELLDLINGWVSFGARKRNQMFLEEEL